LVDSVAAPAAVLLAAGARRQREDVIEASEHVTFEVNCDVHRVDEERCDPRPLQHSSGLAHARAAH